MQLIHQDSWIRRELTAEEAAWLHAGIADGRAAIDLDECLDLDGDLVLEGADYRACLEWLRVSR